MLIAVILSSMIGRVLPWGIPTPLIQIALGFIITNSFDEGITLQPEVFIFLFIPPLLFLDGWRIPKDELKKDRFSIFLLAFGLVIITVLGLGYLLHWLVPSMPLMVAFALAAIVSPTDPVAVNGITRRLPMPRRIMAILEGEGLFNDASGLVAFRMAIAAVMTGTFSLLEATQSFAWVVFAGILMGIVVTRILSGAYRYFSRFFGSDTGADILLSLLMPFAAYALAEHINGSGILAAVTAGLTMGHLELSGRVSTLTRMRRTSMWDTIQFTLNGMIFVLLGEQLPAIFTGAVKIVEQTGHHNPWWLVVYAIVILLALVLLRFLWITVAVFSSKLLRPNLFAIDDSIRWIHIWIMSFAGARGALSLAGVMTLPLWLPDKSAFPARDLAIFLAATVIIATLVAASIALPLLLKKMPRSTKPHSRHGEQRKKALTFAFHQAEKELDRYIQSVDRATLPEGVNLQELKELLLNDFRQTFISSSDPDDPNHQLYLEKQKMRLTIISTVRQSVYSLARHRKISDELARQLVRQLDFDEYRFK